MRPHRREPFAAALVVGLVIVAAAIAGWESMLIRGPGRRTPAPGSTGAAPSADGGAAVVETTVSGESPFPRCRLPGQGQTYTGAEVEPSIAVNPANLENLIVAWQQDRSSTGAARGIVHAVSHDGGRTWTHASSPFGRCAVGNAAPDAAYDRVSDPWVSCGPTGICFSSALGASQSGASGVLVSRSADGGRTWSAAQRIADSRSVDGFNDKETITADPNDPNAVYVVWDRTIQQGQAGTPRSGSDPPDQIVFSRSLDGGVTWSAPRVIGSVAGTPLANQIVGLPDGSLVNVYELRRPGSEGSAGSQQQAIRSTDRGATWSSPVTIAAVTSALVRDPGGGRRIRTGDALPEIAVDPASGRVYVVWTDRFSSGGGSSALARTSIALSQSSDGGLTWTQPRNVNVANPNAFAFTPNVDVAEDGTVAVGYYDLRNDSRQSSVAGPLAADYFVATSYNGELPWTETRLTEASLDMTIAPRSGGFFVGDYMGLAAQGDRFMSAFVETGTAADPTRVIVRSVP